MALDHVLATGEMQQRCGVSLMLPARAKSRSLAQVAARASAEVAPLATAQTHEVAAACPS